MSDENSDYQILIAHFFIKTLQNLKRNTKFIQEKGITKIRSHGS